VGGPAFSLKFREVITVDEVDAHFTGLGVFEVTDSEGNLLFSATYTLDGKRMKAEALSGNLQSDIEINHGTDQRQKDRLDWRSFLKTVPRR
jgi:hypothetical protein